MKKNLLTLLFCFLISLSSLLSQHTHIGSATLSSVLIAPNETGSGDDSEIILGEDHDGTYGMKLFYDGGENKFKIYGKSNTTLRGPHMTIYRDNGYIGIGTVTPTQKVHLHQGRLLLTDQDVPQWGDISIEFDPKWETPWSDIPYNAAIKTNSPNDIAFVNVGVGNGTFAFLSARGVSLYDNDNERYAFIGPNHSTFGHKITCEEIEVKQDAWADFVFGKDYKLKTLNEVEKYITKYNHLPDMPSEKEVIENGINLGDMNALLLQKIEELTLYAIEQQKLIEELKNEVLELKENK